MSNPIPPPACSVGWLRVFELLRRVLSAGVLAFALAKLIGVFTDSSARPPMRPGSAAALILGVLTLWLPPRAGLVAFVVAILLLVSPLAPPVLTAALLFALVASAAMVGWQSTVGAGQTVAGIVVAVGAMELLGYWFGASESGGTGLIGPLSLPTSACLVVLGVAVFFTRADLGPASLLSSDTLTGSSARRTIVMLVLVPIALAWLRLMGQRQGFYGTEVGIALLAASTATVSVTLMLLDARRRLTEERARIAAERGLGERAAQLDAASALASTMAELANERGRFQSVLDVAPMAIFQTDAGGDCTWVNPQWVALTGLSLESALGQGWVAALHPDDKERVFAEWYAAASSRSAFALDYRFRRPDGGVVWVSGSAIGVRDAAGAVTGFVGSVLDVTARRMAEERERESAGQFRRLVAQAPVGMLVTTDGIIRYANDTFLTLLGYTKLEELVGQHSVEFLLPPEHRAEFANLEERERLARAMSGGPRPVLRRDGSMVTLEIVGVQGTFEGSRALITAAVDVTRRVRAEAELAASNARVAESLAEKEVLLQEVHHRVKNNLQVIMSLLSLQAGKSTDESVREVLELMRSRVFAISALHERIYRSKEFGRVEVKDYLEGLVADIVRTAQTERGRPNVTFDVGPLVLDIDHAVPLGLIVNELVNNAMKHATHGDLRIAVTLVPDVTTTTVVVADTGGGAARFSEGASPTLGLSLIKGLARQLDGAIEFETTAVGVRAQLRFPTGPP